MKTVSVDVEEGGLVITTIDRPLREVRGRPAVKYRRRLWFVKDGAIRLEDGPIEEEPAVLPAARVKADPKPEEVAEEERTEVDDRDVRKRIISAGPDVRMLVEAGPGTGKTEMAARRLERLVSQHLSPSEILLSSAFHAAP